MPYETLKATVKGQGGLRFAAHGRLRDRLVDACVEEWPVDCPPDKIEVVLRARMHIRCREQYGSIILSLLLYALVDFVVKAVVAWWFDKRSHRVLMEGWARRAQEDPNF